MLEEDDNLDQLLDSYSSTSIKNAYKNQMKLLKNQTPLGGKTHEKCNQIIQPILFSQSGEHMLTLQEINNEKLSHQIVLESEQCRDGTRENEPERLFSVNSFKPTVRTHTFAVESGSSNHGAVISLSEKSFDNRTTKRAENVVEIIDVIDGDDNSVQEIPTRRYNTRRKATKRHNDNLNQSIQLFNKKGKRPRRSNEIKTDTVDLDQSEDSKKLSILNDECNYKMNVKVLWKSVNIVKIPVRQFQKMSVVFEHFVKEEGLPIEKIMLTFKDKIVTPTDTPESMGLKVWDFIEGGVLNTGTKALVDESDCASLYQDFTIRFQDVNKKAIALPTKPDQHMKIVMIRYAEQVDRPLEQISFLFDGSVVKASDTPRLLDIEDGDVIDVVYH